MIDIPSHSSLEDRIEVARRMKEEMEIDSHVEVLVDNKSSPGKGLESDTPRSTTSSERELAAITTPTSTQVSNLLQPFVWHNTLINVFMKVKAFLLILKMKYSKNEKALSRWGCFGP